MGYRPGGGSTGGSSGGYRPGGGTSTKKKKDESLWGKAWDIGSTALTPVKKTLGGGLTALDYVSAAGTAVAMETAQGLKKYVPKPIIQATLPINPVAGLLALSPNTDPNDKFNFGDVWRNTQARKHSGDYLDLTKANPIMRGTTTFALDAATDPTNLATAGLGGLAKQGFKPVVAALLERASMADDAARAARASNLVGSANTAAEALEEAARARATAGQLLNSRNLLRAPLKTKQAAAEILDLPVPKHMGPGLSIGRGKLHLPLAPDLVNRVIGHVPAGVGRGAYLATQHVPGLQNLKGESRGGLAYLRSQAKNAPTTGQKVYASFLETTTKRGLAEGGAGFAQHAAAINGVIKEYGRGRQALRAVANNLLDKGGAATRVLHDVLVNGGLVENAEEAQIVIDDIIKGVLKGTDEKALRAGRGADLMSKVMRGVEDKFKASAVNKRIIDRGLGTDPVAYREAMAAASKAARKASKKVDKVAGRVARQEGVQKELDDTVAVQTIYEAQSEAPRLRSILDEAGTLTGNARKGFLAKHDFKSMAELRAAIKDLRKRVTEAQRRFPEETAAAREAARTKVRPADAPLAPPEPGMTRLWGDGTPDAADVVSLGKKLEEGASGVDYERGGITAFGTGMSDPITTPFPTGMGHQAMMENLGEWLAYQAESVDDLPEMLRAIRQSTDDFERLKLVDWETGELSPVARDFAPEVREIVQDLIKQVPKDVKPHWRQWLKDFDELVEKAKTQAPKAPVKEHSTRDIALMGVKLEQAGLMGAADGHRSILEGFFEMAQNAENPQLRALLNEGSSGMALRNPPPPTLVDRATGIPSAIFGEHYPEFRGLVERYIDDLRNGRIGEVGIQGTDQANASAADFWDEWLGYADEFHDAAKSAGAPKPPLSAVDPEKRAADIGLKLRQLEQGMGFDQMGHRSISGIVESVWARMHDWGALRLLEKGSERYKRALRLYGDAAKKTKKGYSQKYVAALNESYDYDTGRILLLKPKKGNPYNPGPLLSDHYDTFHADMVDEVRRLRDPKHGDMLPPDHPLADPSIEEGFSNKRAGVSQEDYDAAMLVENEKAATQLEAWIGYLEDVKLLMDEGDGIHQARPYTEAQLQKVIDNSPNAVTRLGAEDALRRVRAGEVVRPDPLKLDVKPKAVVDETPSRWSPNQGDATHYVDVPADVAAAGRVTDEWAGRAKKYKAPRPERTSRIAEYKGSKVASETLGRGDDFRSVALKLKQLEQGASAQSHRQVGAAAGDIHQKLRGHLQNLTDKRAGRTPGHNAFKGKGRPGWNRDYNRALGDSFDSREARLNMLTPEGLPARVIRDHYSTFRRDIKLYIDDLRTEGKVGALLPIDHPMGQSAYNSRGYQEAMHAENLKAADDMDDWVKLLDETRDEYERVVKRTYKDPYSHAYFAAIAQNTDTAVHSLKVRAARLERTLKELSPGVRRAAGTQAEAVKAADDAAAVFRGMQQPEFAQQLGVVMQGELKASPWGAMIDPELADNLIRFATNPSEVKTLGRFLEQTTAMWKSLALLRPGFHVRNFYSGVWMNLMAGVPVSRMVDFGQKNHWYNAAHRAGVDSLKGQRLLGRLTELERKNLDLIHQTIGFGDESREVASRLSSNVVTRNPLWRLQQKATTKGMGIVEEQLRGAMAWDTLIDTGSMDAALDRVYKFHFDYEEFGHYEEKLRTVIPFYTWTARNLPLMVEMMVKKPRAFANTQHALRAAQSSGATEHLPEWMTEQGGVQVTGGEQGGRVLAPGLPLDAAMEASNFGLDQSGNKKVGILEQANPLVMFPIGLVTGIGEAFGTFDKMKDEDKKEALQSLIPILGTGQRLDTLQLENWARFWGIPVHELTPERIKMAKRVAAGEFRDENRITVPIKPKKKGYRP